MRSAFLVILSLIAAFCFGSGAAQAQIVPLAADTYVNAANSATNFGKAVTVNVGPGMKGLLRFDLSILPAGSTAASVSKAVLTVYVDKLTVSGAVDVAPVTSAWSEQTVNFNNQPIIGAPVAAAPVSTLGSYVSFDVTTLVQGWVASPPSNLGVALTSDPSTPSVSLAIDGKENKATSHPAMLQIMR